MRLNVSLLMFTTVLNVTHGGFGQLVLSLVQYVTSASILMTSPPDLRVKGCGSPQPRNN